MRSIILTAALTLITLAAAGRTSVGQETLDFTLSTQPYKVLRKAALLLPQTDTPALTRQEAVLFEDAADGRIERLKLDDVALISDGVTDQKTRNRYRAKIAAITEEARKAIVDGKTPEE